MELLPTLFLACLTVWHFGAASPGDGPLGLDPASAYALDDLQGPFANRQAAEAATCANPDAQRVVVEGETPEDVLAKLTALFPAESQP